MTPFLWKYVTLLSKNSSCTLLGQEHHLFEGKVSLTKNIILYPPKASHLKRRIAHPQGILRMFSIQKFLNNDLTRIKMNQIWFGLIWINPKEPNTQRNGSI
jgi:hypothetical protein